MRVNYSTGDRDDYSTLPRSILSLFSLSLPPASSVSWLVVVVFTVIVKYFDRSFVRVSIKHI